jgi:catechol 2,3-dioxygenase-like lactoylglutathione lyase family enzyme
MAVQLNHTIIPVPDKLTSARFLADVLGLGPPTPLGPFLCVETANGVSLDYDDRWGSVPGHYAFLVTEEEFEAIFSRIQERELPYWADPGHQQKDEINDNGRGFYFEDPAGNNLEVLTRPYGT